MVNQTAMNASGNEKQERNAVRTILIRSGITLTIVSGAYVAAGLAGLVPLSLEQITWNNIRIVSGLSILGCLMAAIGYGDE